MHSAVFLLVIGNRGLGSWGGFVGYDLVDRFLIDELTLVVRFRWVAGTDLKSAPTGARWAG